MKKLLRTVISVSGFVPGHLGPLRLSCMLASLAFAFIWLPRYHSLAFAMLYFLISTMLYVGWVFLVLPRRGLRLQLIRNMGEEKAYRCHEGLLGFAYFHNAMALGYVAQCTQHTGSWLQGHTPLLLTIAALLLIAGTGVKLWAAMCVGIPVYYFKDMFLGRPVATFTAEGPYRYLRHPMYGVGQLQVYGMALYYHSAYGLLFALINQALVFAYCYLLEKPFVKRVYLSGVQEANRKQPRPVVHSLTENV